MMRGRSRPLALALLALVGFVLLATLNSGGYRYGASDQAFYAPAALKQINPALYPRDAALLAAQGRLTFVDNVVGVLGRLSGLTLPAMFAALYLVSLTAVATGAWRIGRSLYRQPWTAVALLAALTLRHAITKSGTNTLEGYFHPRQLAFGIGLIAVSCFLRGSWPLAALLALAAGAIHPTTALWFCVWLAVAIALTERRARTPLAIAGAIAALGAAWLLMGPLSERLVRMDREWLETLVTKDYLFPLRWPLSAWLVNLAYIPLIVWLYRRRVAAGVTVPRERGLVAGCLVLPAIFLLSLPLHAVPLALAVQLQPARLFWMLDFLAIVYVVWALAEGFRTPAADGSVAAKPRRRAMTAAAIIALLSTTRGLYSKLILVPERPVAQIDIPETDWGRAMAWARRTETGSGWIADPGHTWKYGSSVRVAGQRDVLVEPVKDAAVGMYEREIALAVRDRMTALGDFASLSPERARALATQYNLDYLITDQQVDLPLAFDAGSLRIYRLR